ncbi:MULTISPECIES: hypothetical protein [unclassified Marinobacter]|uniref:hypothetical protein n=1 Tax=unclassified Marinobacter TaxID=83889 RepID=UPI001928B60B|nr:MULTISPECIES: hypothetical protein [unclassified Marinobacter]MBL3827228.1 hypothetical protein [Marinobacter sp. MC3]MBL3895682.1 hypothetical protein [Marinobacter sp. MW3]
MASTTPQFHSQTQLLPLGEISELHEILQNARKKYQLPPLAQPNQADIHLAHVRTLLEVFPIFAHRSRNKLRCVGNVRFWELCRAWLDPDQMVPVNLVSGRFKADFWARNYLLETYYANVLFGLNADDGASLYRLSNEWTSDLELPPIFPSKAAYGRAMRIGKGRMARG